MLKNIKKLIFKIISLIFYCIKHLIPTKEKMIIFTSYHGRSYSCNPKYVHQEIINRSDMKDFKLIWALNDPTVKIQGATVVKYQSLKYFYYLAKSKFWIFNCKMPEYYSKKKNQVYIQLWHGTCLKRLGKDIEDKKGKTYTRLKISYKDMVKSYTSDSKKYNYMISPNTYCTGKFQSAFEIKSEKLKEFGYPRNDYLVNLNTEDIPKIKTDLGLPQDKKIILYAPTWRDNSHTLQGYTFELKCDFKKWQKELGDEYIVIFKPHYLIKNTFNDSFNEFVYNMPSNIDINKLYAVSDVLITDYSSVFFDYSLLKRPIMFYMYDIEEYKDELRGFYLDIHSELPGSIYTKEDELIDCLKNNLFMSNENVEKLNKFYERFSSKENGTASKQVVDELILSNIRKK